jgi:hypothetical protein
MLSSQNNTFILRNSPCNSLNFLHTILKCGECTQNHRAPVFWGNNLRHHSSGTERKKRKCRTIHVLCETWKTIFGERLPLLPRHEVFRMLRNAFRNCEVCLEAAAGLFETLLWNEANWTVEETQTINSLRTQALYAIKLALMAWWSVGNDGCVSALKDFS